MSKLAAALDVSLEWLIRGDEPSRVDLAKAAEGSGEHAAVEVDVPGNGTHGPSS